MMPEFFNEMPEDLTGLGRRAAVVLPKDFGAVVAYTGLKSDWVVAEAGAGSGFMTVQLARISKHVYSYENREEHYKVALANITKLGLDNVTLINADISTLDKNDLNLIFLDFKDSYNYIEDMHKHLRKNGWLVGYLPKAFQVCDTFYQFVNKGEHIRFASTKHPVRLRQTPLYEKGIFTYKLFT